MFNHRGKGALTSARQSAVDKRQGRIWARLGPDKMKVSPTSQLQPSVTVSNRHTLVYGWGSCICCRHMLPGDRGRRGLWPSRCFCFFPPLSQAVCAVFSDLRWTASGSFLLTATLEGFDSGSSAPILAAGSVDPVLPHWQVLSPFVMSVLVIVLRCSMLCVSLLVVFPCPLPLLLSSWRLLLLLVLLLVASPGMAAAGVALAGFLVSVAH